MQEYQKSTPEIRRWQDMSGELEEEQEPLKAEHEHDEPKGGAPEQHRTMRH